MKKEVNKQVNDAKLLVGKILGELNDVQEENLRQWESNSDNKELENSLLNGDEFAEWSDKTDAIDTSVEWEKFVAKMDSSTKKGKKISLSIYKAVAGVAAVLVLGVAIYFSVQTKDTDTHYQTLAEADIHPGSSQAQLILSDGKVIELEDVSIENIAEGNVSIKNQKGIVEYNSESVGKALKPVMNTLRIPRGGEYQLVLPDGTKVWLNSDTELKYSVPFEGNVRKVVLSGEAYFDVMPDKNRPFIVETVDQSVEVLGTEFNVSAYNEDLNIVTTLVEGKVKVELVDENNVMQKNYLVPNEQLVLDKESMGVQKNIVDTQLYTSWKDGRFVFKKEPLESFLKTLSRWYNVEAFITDESIKNIRFTGDLPRYKNMEDVLKIIEAEMSVHIDIEDNKIIYVSK